MSEKSQSSLSQFFGVAVRGQTYLNLVYLFLAFPLGLFYFILLVTGFSLGFGLLIIWVGILILAGMFVASWACANFERQLAIQLLHENIPDGKSSAPAGMTTWDQIKSHFANPVTWKSLVYLLVKFPLGILSFTVLVTLITLSLALIATPVLYPYCQTGVWHCGIPASLIDTMPEAIIVSLSGVALLFPSLHIFNWLAWISGRFAKIMLS